MKKLLTFTVFSLLLLGVNSISFAGEEGKKLFVNLISDDLDRAAMAIGISNKVLSTEKITVTIFLSAQGVRWADKRVPQNRHVSGKTIADMLQDFMKSGGQVIVCKMCMRNVGGMTEEDTIEGVRFSGAIATLFADNTTVLTY